MVKRRILTIAVVLWLAVIFLMSAKPADESADMSLSVGHIIGKVFVRDYGQMTEGEKEEFAERINYPVRKAAHASEYAILGILLTAALGSYNVEGKRRFAAAWMAGTLYAASDEFYQLFVPGRSGCITDVMIDSGGLLAGILLLMAVQRWKKGVYSRKLHEIWQKP